MQIVIATGIYPPEIGGPALYAKGVHESLKKMGHDAPVVLFGTLRRFPSGLRHILYAIKLFAAARKASAIFAFDTYSVGLPASLVGMILRIPVVIRIGGDFVWEMYIERTKERIPLPDFYLSPRALSLKERVAEACVRWMLHHARLAFNTKWLLDIWQKPYALDATRARVVENVIGEKLGSLSRSRTILLFGRNIALKNTDAFRRAFKVALDKGINLTLEEGMVPHAEFIQKIRGSYAVAIPSVSEIAPNNVIDAILCGKPFLLTKYSGYAERFKEYGIMINPLDEGDMARGITELADPKIYSRLCARIAAFNERRTYEDVAREFIAMARTNIV